MQIRANQGHTIKDVEPELTKLQEPFQIENVVHGTYEKNWDLIQKKGLSRMKRNHIHFAKGLPDQQGVISGMRQDCNLLIYVHIPTAVKGNFSYSLGQKIRQKKWPLIKNQHFLSYPHETW